jgi:predicted ATPase
VDPLVLGGNITIAFRRRSGRGDETFEFGPVLASAGELHTAFVLASLFQLAAVDGRIPLITVEEPGAFLHPGAAGVLFDALNEASEHVQLIITSHSADLLDRKDLDVSTIRTVSVEAGETLIGEVDEASREIVKDQLYTIGELMRGNQLSPGPTPRDEIVEPED